jgi:Fe-S oxidoreductase
MEIPSEILKQIRTPMPVLPVEDRKGNFKEMELGFTEDIAVREAQRCLSCECLACKKNCEFLSHHNISPREFVGRLKQDYSVELTVPFSCNICNLCGKMCPEGFDTGNLCLEVRKKAVNDGLAPLPQHKSVHNYQKCGTSRAFKLGMADPQNKKETSRVFFPGCNLSSYSPDLVVKTFNYLRDKLPGTGIILNCCGSPTYLIGEMDRFQEIIGGIEKLMTSLGASEIITACSKCYYILKNNMLQWKVRSLYGLMADVGLPESVPEKFSKVFSIHDSCPARYEEDLRQGVRTVMDRLGCDFEEMEFSGEKTRCCGGGGMIEAVDPELFEKAKIRRVSETLNDIVTYCAACRDNFASLEKASLHILDLVFNPNWEQDRMRPPGSSKQSWKNRWELKKLLKKLQPSVEE